MIRQFFMIASMVITLTATAQTSPQAKASVAKIREMYADAKKAIESIPLKVEDGRPRDDMVISSNYMAAGAGPINDVTHYYFSGDFDEELSCEVYKTYFVSRKFNVGALQYYQEFMFDDDCQLAFFYERLDSGPACEVRYYYEKNALVHQVVKGEQTTDDMHALRLANDLIEVFNRMQNRNYD